MDVRRTTSPRACAAVAIWLSAGAIAAAQGGQGQVGRDVVRPATLSGHSSLAGVVVTDQSPAAPIARVTVSVDLADGDRVATAYTDGQGHFQISNLPAGRYVLVATKPAYVRAPFGARRYDRPATPITLGDGQALADLKIVMARGAVITGVVTDGGQPVPGVPVRLTQFRTVAGVRTLQPVVQTGGLTVASTDDHGTYRIFGLPAGDYIVSATPRLVAGGDVRQMTPADIQSVREALQALTATATNATMRPPDPVTVTYATVYYPSTTVAANATPVSVSSGEERTGIDLTLQLVHTAHIDGMVVTPPGVPPQSVSVLLAGSGSDSGLDLMPLMIALNRVVPGPDGHFTFTGIAPGSYTLTARVTVQGGNGANANIAAGRGLAPVPSVAPGAQGPTLWGQADVSVNGENVSGVSVTLQPGMTISGRVVAETTGVAPPDLTRARVTLTPASTPGGLMIGVPTASVDATGRFALTSVVPGRYRLTASLDSPGASWTAKSALIKGRDALDVPFDVAPNDSITNAAVTFTTHTQSVSGHLVDASGRPATDFTIILFPADETAWGSVRRVRTARPATDGRFEVANVPAGDYRLAAVVDVAPGEASDPALLQEIVPASIAITIQDGEQKVQDLRLAGGRSHD